MCKGTRKEERRESKKGRVNGAKSWAMERRLKRKRKCNKKSKKRDFAKSFIYLVLPYLKMHHEILWSVRGDYTLFISGSEHYLPQLVSISRKAFFTFCHLSILRGIYYILQIYTCFFTSIISFAIHLLFLLLDLSLTQLHRFYFTCLPLLHHSILWRRRHYYLRQGYILSRVGLFVGLLVGWQGNWQG